MGKIGTTELIIVLILVLVIFGPSKLPEIGKALGKGISSFKSHVKNVSSDEMGHSHKDKDEEPRS